MIHPAELDTLTVDFKRTQAGSIIIALLIWRSICADQRLSHEPIVGQVLSELGGNTELFEGGSAVEHLQPAFACYPEAQGGDEGIEQSATDRRNETIACKPS
jgi:hypothetical protein